MTKSTAMITFDSATGRSVAKVATYNQKDGTDELDLNNFEVTHTYLGAINHETKEHSVEAFTKQIVLQSQKDGIEIKKLKAKINAMAEYINSLKGLSLVSNDQP